MSVSVPVLLLLMLVVGFLVVLLVRIVLLVMVLRLLVMIVMRVHLQGAWRVLCMCMIPVGFHTLHGR